MHRGHRHRQARFDPDGHPFPRGARVVRGERLRPRRTRQGAHPGRALQDRSGVPHRHRGIHPGGPLLLHVGGMSHVQLHGGTQREQGVLRPALQEALRHRQRERIRPQLCGPVRGRPHRGPEEDRSDIPEDRGKDEVPRVRLPFREGLLHGRGWGLLRGVPGVAEAPEDRLQPRDVLRIPRRRVVPRPVALSRQQGIPSGHRVHQGP